jgi:uncharacterized protein YdaU (DUF1376 family)
MPMYWGSYLSDTTHFSRELHGSYMLLIAFYWCNGGLPEDEESIRLIAKCTKAEWKRDRKFLFAKFSPSWKHKRIDAELAKSLKKQEQARANALQRHYGGNATTLTLTKKKEEEGTINGYAFESGVIKLTQKNLDLWKKAFSHLDVPAELLALTEWANGLARGKWFGAVSAVLNKKNRAQHDKPKSEKPFNRPWTDAL